MWESVLDGCANEERNERDRIVALLYWRTEGLPVHPGRSKDCAKTGSSIALITELLGLPGPAAINPVVELNLISCADVIGLTRQSRWLYVFRESFKHPVSGLMHNGHVSGEMG